MFFFFFFGGLGGCLLVFSRIIGTGPPPPQGAYIRYYIYIYNNRGTSDYENVFGIRTACFVTAVTGVGCFGSESQARYSFYMVLVRLAFLGVGTVVPSQWTGRPYARVL